MKKNPLVSVVVPMYNEEKYISYCLESLLEQTYNPLEIICVDDGSTDNSSGIVSAFPNITLIERNHIGPGAARNAGIDAAKGEIIAFADADMKFDKKYIEILIKPIVQKKAIGTFVKEEYVANKNNIWSKCWSINSGLPYDRRLPKNYMNQTNAFRAILKKYIKDARYETQEGYTDDSSLSKKIKVFALNAPGAKSYHFNPSSLPEVFYSSRWIGRSVLFQKSFTNFFRFSLFNSLRISTKYLLKGAPIQIIPFKLTFDAGMFVGIFFSGNKSAK